MSIELLILIAKTIWAAIVWMVFAGFSAYSEAFYHDCLYKNKYDHPNLHPTYTFIRVMMALALVVFTASYLYWMNACLFGVFCFCSFSFIHNGVLYATRNNITPEIYKKRWWANKERGDSKNSSNLEIEVGFRTGLFAISIIDLIWMFREEYYRLLP